MTDVLTLTKDHDYFLNNHPLDGVSEILKRAGLVDFSGIPADVLERARKFGKAGHLMTELYDRKTLDIKTVDDALLPFLEGWKNFLCIGGYEIVEIEKPVHSKKWGYGGTPDRWLRQGIKYVIPDIKFTAAIVPPNRIQVAAYELAKREMTGITSGRIIVRLTGDKAPYYKIHTLNDPADYQVWMGACQTSKFKKKEASYYGRSS